MSDQVLRDKHARRISQKQRSIKRQVKIAKSKGYSVEDQPHRYAKHNALNCNVPKCLMCGNPRHNGYAKQKLTMQELRFKDSGKIDYE